MAHRSGAQVALIIEEGVALHLRDGDRESSGAAVSRIMSHADDRVRGWHTLQLHVVNATLQLDMCTTATRPLAPWSKDHGSATAYLVSRSGMQAVLDATDDEDGAHGGSAMAGAAGVAGKATRSRSSSSVVALTEKVSMRIDCGATCCLLTR